MCCTIPAFLGDFEFSHSLGQNQPFVNTSDLNEDQALTSKSSGKHPCKPETRNTA